MDPVVAAPDSSARRMQLFFALLHLETEERRRELERLRQAEPDAAASLDALLAHDAAARADGFLAGRAVVRALAPGAWVGPYQIERVLGQGGMGTVYLAHRHEPFRQAVAIKQMRPDLPGYLAARFDAERQLLATLVHPGIVHLLDGGADRDGQPYLVMEYVPGARLDEHCRGRATTVEERVRLVHAVAEALAFAHRRGVVHRDLKPSNVLVGEDGRPRVTDFGLAKLAAAAAAEAGAGATLTGTGWLLGTPPYMAPERLAPGPGRDEPGVDVYALGVILFELLAGRLPFLASGAPLERYARAIREDAPPLRRSARSVPRDLETIVARALARDPRERFADAGALAEQLRRFLAREPLTIHPPTPTQRLARWAARYRRPLLAWAASTAVVLVAAVAVLSAGNAALRRDQDALRGTMRGLWLSSARLVEELPPSNPALRAFHEEVTRSFDAVLAEGRLEVEPALVRQVAVMHRHLAAALEGVGEAAEARAHLDISIDLLRPLPARVRDPEERAWTEFDLFRSLALRSAALRELGDLAAALESANAALALIRALVAQSPDDPAWGEALARQLLMQADLLDRLGRRDASRAAKQEALVAARAAARRAPDDPVKLNTVLAALACSADALPTATDRERLYREALEVARRLDRLPGGDWTTRDAQSMALMRLALFYKQEARPAEAIPLYEEAMRRLAELIALAPERADFATYHREVLRAIAECRAAAGPNRHVH